MCTKIPNAPWGGGGGGSVVRDIKVQLFNIRSIKQNFDDFISQLMDVEADVVVLTETWLFAAQECLFKLKGFKSFFKSNEKYRSGGVAIFVKDTIPSFEIRITEKVECDCCIVELLIEGNRFQVAGIYRSPSRDVSNTEVFASNGIQQIVSKLDRRADCLLMGDINLCMLNINGHTSTYLDELAMSGFLALNDRQPTRLSETGSSLIDHVFSRGCRGFNHKTTIADSRGVSDHCLINLMLNVERETELRTSKSFIKTDYEQIKNRIAGVSWSLVCDAAGSEESSRLFQEQCSSLVRSCSKKYSIATRLLPLKEWVTPGLVRSIRKRDKLHKQHLKQKTLKSKIEYESYTRVLHRLTRRIKAEFYSKKFSEVENNPRKVWKFVNSIFRGKTSSDDISPQLVNKSIAQINCHFAQIGLKTIRDKVGTVDPLKDLPEPSTNEYILSEFIVPGTEELVSLMKGLSGQKASGLDGIPSKLFKENSEIMTAPVRGLIDKIFSSSIYPSNLKVSLLRPIHKSGSQSDINNFRPISLLSTLNKIVEKVIAEQLMTFLENNSILNTAQFGFRRGRSCEEAAFTLTNLIGSSIGRNESCVAIFCDLSKAFDTIDHPRLLNKLHRLGVRGRALSLLRSYLINRQQIFKLNDESSEPSSVPCGVPQGSVLGPLLFITYINDLLGLDTPAKIMSFADDTVLFIESRGQNIPCLLNRASESMTLVAAWMHTNGLVLNSEKTKYMFFGKRTIDESLKDGVVSHSTNCVNQPCRCTCLERVRRYKYLGLLIEDTLKYKLHVERVAAKVRAGVAVLSRLRNFGSLSFRKSVYSALVQSHIGYMLAIYGGDYATTIDTLIKLQKKAIRHVCSATYLAHTAHLFNITKMLDLTRLYALYLLKLLYPTLGRLPRPSHAHQTRFRSEGNLIPTCGRKLVQRSAQSNFIKLFNSLPTDLKCILENPPPNRKKIYITNLLKNHIYNTSSKDISIILK